MRGYDKIVIGATFSSVLYAFHAQIPIIFVEGHSTHPFDFYSPDVDLSLFKIEPFQYTLQSPGDTAFVFGASKQQVSDKLLALLSLSGLVPFSHLAKSISISDDSLRIVTEGKKTFNVEYGELLVFDDKGIRGLPPAVEDDKNRITPVLDWFNMNLGSNHDMDYVETGDDFVKQIFFYPSTRRGVKAGGKDLLAISYLPAQDAAFDYQYSDTYARFKVTKILKERGFRGPKNGKNSRYPDRSSEPFLWLSPKVSHGKREILSLPMGKYQDTERIKFFYDTPEDMISKSKMKLDTYTFKLLSSL